MSRVGVRDPVVIAERQAQVRDLVLVKGMTARDAAKALGIPERTASRDVALVKPAAAIVQESCKARLERLVRQLVIETSLRHNEQHGEFVSWWSCSHPICQSARAALEE